jgi:hypothetical protein
MRIIDTLTATAVALLLPGAVAQAAPTNLSANQSTIKYSKTASGASGFGNYARATSTVVYDPVTGIYTLRDTGSLTIKSSFGPANVTSSNATFVTYRKTSGSTVETFRRLNNNPSNPLIVLNYVDYGQWRRATTSAGTTNVNDTYLVFGTKTTTTPTSGTGNYSTVLDGTWVDPTGSYAVSGTGSLTANFGGGTIAYSATANATPETSGAAFSFGSMTGSGTIHSPGGTFNGTGGYNSSHYAMDVTGNFYGPSAQEVGGLFRLRKSTGGGSGTGALVGK